MSEEKRNERYLLLAVFLFWFSVYTYPSFLTTYVTNTLGATKVLAGTVIGSYGLMQMILRIPLGIVSDVMKKRKVFVMAGFAFSIISACGLTAVAVIAGRENVPGWLSYAVLIFRGMAGIVAATWVNFSVLYSSSYKGDEVAPAMSRIIVPQCGSQIVAMLLGAQLAGNIGEIWAFVLSAVAGVAGFAVMSRVREQKPEGDPMSVWGFLEVAKNRQLLTGALLAAVYQLIVWSTAQGFVQNWAKEVVGLATAQLGYLSVANLLPNTVLSRFSGTVFAPKFGRKTVLTAGFVAMAGACLLYPRTTSLVSMLAVQALLGSGVGLIMPLTMASAIETVPNAKRGAAMGIYQAVYGIGMFTGPVLSGVVIERFGGSAAGVVPVQGYIANFYVAMGIALNGAFLAFLLVGRRH